MNKKHLLVCLLILVRLSAFSNTQETNPLLSISSKGSGKLLSDYITMHLEIIRNNKGLSQGQILRHFTYTSIALYESIANGDIRYRPLGGQLQELEAFPTLASDGKTCWHASANAAYAAMLKTFYASNPSSVKKADSLKNHYNNLLLKEGYTKENIQKASDYGDSVASFILRWSKSDGSAKSYPAYEVPKGNGLWEPTPPAFAAPLVPYASNTRTCVKNSTANTLPPPPIPFSVESSSAFYKMVNEVYTVSQSITPEQKAIALFWDDFPDGRYYGASGHWASIFKQVANTKQLSLIEASEAFVKMHIAIADAFNACWKGKYTYNLLRPVTYIQKHMKHADWQPLIITPAHPEYPAAHASLSMAAATALTNALGNNIAFADHSYDDMGFEPRRFKNFEEAGREAGMSRLYGGIHYRPSIEAGYVLGAKTANNALSGLSFKK